MLLNFGNTAPLLARRQLVVIHDAGVFRTPAAYSRRFRLWYKFLHASLARSQACIATVSQFSRAELVATLGVPPGRIHVVPEGADHMHRLAADPGVLAKHGLVQERYVLAVGTLAAHKNLASLGRLSERLAERGIALAITGALGGQAFAGNAAQRLPRSANYLGRVSDAELKALYQNAGCFVFPSRYEGFGLPAVEAMACGCPVVAADIPALRESCGDAALFCDPLSGEAIATAVLRMLEDAPLRAAFRERAAAHVAAMSWANAAQALAGILHAAEQPARHAGGSPIRKLSHLAGF
jgi:glycosyltransferase involved in cell wall biosynthesis